MQHLQSNGQQHVHMCAFRRARTSHSHIAHRSGGLHTANSAALAREDGQCWLEHQMHAASTTMVQRTLLLVLLCRNVIRAALRLACALRLLPRLTCR